MKNDSLWYKDAVFYQLNVRTFLDSNGDGHGDFGGIVQKADYLARLGVDAVWIMPFYPSPLYDDGYDISDYCDVAPLYGTLADFDQAVAALHERNIRVVIDLVINHTSIEHPWFRESRSSTTSPRRDWYVWSRDNQKYKEARIIFIDTESSNWTLDETTGEYYWHRFYRQQPDLNFDNPEVQEAMLDVMRFWLNRGIDGFRVDAVPYLIEREGTNCENLPETHDYIRRMRQVVDEEYPGRIMLAEANQWPHDLLPYLAEDREFHMAFHFPIMPRLYMALRKHQRQDIVDILNQTPPIPSNTQWCIFLRNHDELTLEMVTEAQRQWMWQEYAPEPGMKLNLGIRRRLAPLVDGDSRKILLLNTLLFSLPGTPIVYNGDEIGMGDDITQFDRNGVRTPMQWDSSLNAGFTTSAVHANVPPVIDRPPYSYRTVNVAAQEDEQTSLLNQIRHLIRIRRQHSVFGRGTFQLIEVENPALLVYERKLENPPAGTPFVLVAANLSDHAQELELLRSSYTGQNAVNLLTQTDYTASPDGIKLILPAYGCLWLTLQSGV